MKGAPEAPLPSAMNAARTAALGLAILLAGGAPPPARGPDKARRIDALMARHHPDHRGDTGRKITLEHLLTHASGLPCYTRQSGFWREHAAVPHSVAEFVRACCSQDLEFEPGTRRAYSNSGYYLLGAILERVSGRPYGELLRERILEPAGMRDTGFDREGKVLAECATGYLRSDGRLQKAPPVDPTVAFSAGGLHSTVEDLYLLDRALAAGRLLSREQQDLMTAPRPGSYGYGWIVESLRAGEGPREVLAVSHSGGINGYSGDLCRLPGEGHFVALLANQMSGAARLHRVSLEIAGLLCGAELRKAGAAPAAAPPPVPPDAPPEGRPAER